MLRALTIIGLAVLLGGCGAGSEGGEGKGTQTPDGGAAPEFIAMRGENLWAMVLPQGADPAQFPVWAKERCGAAAFCKVFAWTDKASAARAMPLTDAELSALAFSYGLNRDTGFEQALWDCTRFAQADTARCL